MCQYRREIADSGCGSRKNNLVLNLVWTKELLADFMREFCGVMYLESVSSFKFLGMPSLCVQYVAKYTIERLEVYGGKYTDRLHYGLV